MVAWVLYEKNYIEINTNTVENTATWWPGRCMRRIAVAGIEGKYKIQNTKYKIQQHGGLGAVWGGLRLLALRANSARHENASNADIAASSPAPTTKIQNYNNKNTNTK